MSKVRAIISACVVSTALVAGLMGMEGKENTAYVDRLPSVPVVTICYGHTATAKLGQYKTDDECGALLMQDLRTVYAPIVRKYVKVPLSQGEFNALVDFVYNVGEPKFARSTLLRKLNAGDYAGAQAEFRKWSFVGGKDCNIPANKCGGIPKRRAWEAKLFAS